MRTSLEVLWQDTIIWSWQFSCVLELDDLDEKAYGILMKEPVHVIWTFWDLSFVQSYRADLGTLVIYLFIYYEQSRIPTYIGTCKKLKTTNLSNISEMLVNTRETYWDPLIFGPKTSLFLNKNYSFLRVASTKQLRNEISLIKKLLIEKRLKNCRCMLRNTSSQFSEFSCIQVRLY